MFKTIQYGYKLLKLDAKKHTKTIITYQSACRYALVSNMAGLQVMND